MTLELPLFWFESFSSSSISISGSNLAIWNSGGYRDRTDDLSLAKAALSQLS